MVESEEEVRKAAEQTHYSFLNLEYGEEFLMAFWIWRHKMREEFTSSSLY